MPIRTDDSSVQAILADVDTDVDMSPLIEAASGMIDDNCLESGYPSSKLERLETWLSAHLYESIYGRVQSEQVTAGSSAGLRIAYFLKNGLGLDQTVYGQMVKRLDNKGNLAALDNALNTIKKPLLTPSVTWLGQASE